MGFGVKKSGLRSAPGPQGACGGFRLPRAERSSAFGSDRQLSERLGSLRPAPRPNAREFPEALGSPRSALSGSARPSPPPPLIKLRANYSLTAQSRPEAPPTRTLPLHVVPNSTTEPQTAPIHPKPLKTAPEFAPAPPNPSKLVQNSPKFILTPPNCPKTSEFTQTLP